ncbi:MAG: Ig-like domain-containing protein [Marinobacter sp.]|nr:Ig-like domain-containing protein [Marinobacter sp.]
MTIQPKLSLLTAATLALALAGCGGDSTNPGNPRVPVDVIDRSNNGGELGNQEESLSFCEDPEQLFRIVDSGITPADGATGVALNTAVVVRFNRAIDPGSVNSSTLFLSGEGLGPVTYRVNGANVTLDPEGDLRQNTEYTLTLTGGLAAAECADDPDNTKTLRSEDIRDSRFTTGEQPDITPTEVERINPMDGQTVVPITASVVIEFNKPIRPSSVDSNAVIIRDHDGKTVAGQFEVEETRVIFSPEPTFATQTDYTVEVTTRIRDINDQTLAGAFTSSFRTGGLVTVLNEELISQIPGLGDLVNLLTGELFDALNIANAEDGLSGLENLVILRIPLIDPASYTGVLEGELPNYDTNLVAICDPASSARNCIIKLDIPLDPIAFADLADAIAGGDPAALPQAFGNLLLGEDGLIGVNLDVLGVDSLNALGPLGDLLYTITDELQSALDNIPVLNDLVLNPLLNVINGDTDQDSLVYLGLLQGALLNLEVGELLSLELLSLDGEPIDLSGSLIDGLIDGLLTLRSLFPF